MMSSVRIRQESKQRSGDQAPIEVREGSLAEWFTDRASEYGDLPAAVFRDDGEFVEWSYEDLLNEGRAVAGWLQNLGLEPGDRLAIQSTTRHEWSVLDIAAILSGVVLVPVYTTFRAGDAAYVIEDAGAEYLVAEGTDVAPEIAETVEDVFDVGSLPKGELDGTPGATREGDDLAALIYTSGTTGNPKGVRLTHRNLLAEIAILRYVFPNLEPGRKGTCYLPLASLAQRIMNFKFWDQGHAPVYMSPDSLIEDLVENEPEILLGVPRVWRRMYSGIQEKVAEMSGLKGSLAEWGIDVAREFGSAREQGSCSRRLRSKRVLADRVVHSKLKENLGLSNVEYAVTGAASLDAEILHFFWGMDIPLIEVYGATETTAVCTGNRMDDFRAGTVGKAVPGVDVRLTDDGEVMVRGPIVMDGYWKLPGKTDEVLEDGWYRTGDVGQWDGDYLQIIDRKKFKAVLDTGRNVYPEPIEAALRRSSYVEEVMIVADDRKFVSAVVQPNFEQLLAFADSAGVEYDESDVERHMDDVEAVPAELVEHAAVRDLFEEEIARANEELAEYETVKEFRVIERRLSIDREELTPTLKKRRNTIADHFSDRIEAMYAD